MKTRNPFILLSLATLFLLTGTLRAQSQEFVDMRPADEFLTIDVHLLAGTSVLTQNYMGTFSEIRELNASGGTAWGAGVSAVFGLRNYLGLGTELNLVSNSCRFDLVVSNDPIISVSNIYLRNRYYYANIPVYMSLRFNVVKGLRWIVNGGLYYSYGLGGHQKQTIYNSSVNELGQFIQRKVENRTDFFNDKEAFANTYKRGDIGLHLATSLLFGRHLSIGCRMQIGFKNIAYSEGIACPNIHNFNYMVTAGYNF